MIDASKLKADILSDMRVELSDEFDRNFERKAFFSDKWKPRAHDYPRGSLLMVSSALRRSVKGGAETLENGVRFSSAVPYASIHNEGGTGYKMVRSHQRKIKKTGKVYTVRAHQRKFNMPQRQFIGDGPDTQRIIRSVIDRNLKNFNLSLESFIRK